MNDFSIYQQAIVDYLNHSGKSLLFCIQGESHDTFAVVWDNPSDAITYTDSDIQPFYDAIVMAKQDEAGIIRQQIIDLQRLLEELNLT